MGKRFSRLKRGLRRFGEAEKRGLKRIGGVIKKKVSKKLAERREEKRIYGEAYREAKLKALKVKAKREAREDVLKKKGGGFMGWARSVYESGAFTPQPSKKRREEAPGVGEGIFELLGVEEPRKRKTTKRKKAKKRKRKKRR